MAKAIVIVFQHGLDLRKELKMCQHYESGSVGRAQVVAMVGLVNHITMKTMLT